jgi:divalent metal cation (Fe/Co/Zn/Cd) transporter
MQTKDVHLKRRLTQACFSLMARKGIKGFSLDDIASDLGISKKTIYQVYSSNRCVAWFSLLDPIVGLGIGAAILGIVWKSAQDMWHRMMDAVDPEVHEEFRHIASHIPGVFNVHNTAIRWLGHRLYGEMHITVNCQQTTLQSHFISEEVRHSLFHKLPALVEVVVHVNPCECDDMIDYHLTRHHIYLPAAD